MKVREEESCPVQSWLFSRSGVVGLVTLWTDGALIFEPRSIGRPPYRDRTLLRAPRTAEQVEVALQLNGYLATRIDHPQPMTVRLF
ncbi:MAG TPA: hypothetical protein VGB64_03960 [Actinomycetota bacterium]